MRTPDERLAFLKQFAKALISVGKTVEFLLSDNSIPLDEKEKKSADLFQRKVTDLVSKAYYAEHPEAKQIRQQMENQIAQTLGELGIPNVELVDPVTGQVVHRIDAKNPPTDEDFDPPTDDGLDPPTDDDDLGNNPAWLS